MPKNKPPKVLPAIKFDPPFSGETDTGWRGEQGGAGKGDYLTGLQYNPINYYNPSTQNMPQGTDMGNGETAYPNPAYNPLPPAQPPAYGPRSDGYVQNPAFLQGRAEGATGLVGAQAGQVADWYTQAGVSVGQGVGGPSRPGPSDTGAPAPLGGSTDDIESIRAARTTDAVQKNQTLTEKAKASGDSEEMRRLDAEWARLTSTPLYKQMYGGANELDIKNRLINSYMQPDNEAAEPSFDRAHARMVTDDWWAEQASMAFGRPPNQLEWDEHWRAMNKGGRDPLEGHPQAIQNLEAKKEELKRMNQQAAYDALQQWQTMSGNL
jgi:hypothetical protein